MKPGFDFIGVSVSFYCNDGQGKFLFHKRSVRCRDEHGRWEPGGGKLEFGETPREGALREILEEYGCVGEIQESLPAISVSREWEGKRSHWVSFPFFIKVDPASVRIGEPDYMDELGWFTLDALPTPLHRGFQTIFESYKQYFEKYRAP